MKKVIWQQEFPVMFTGDKSPFYDKGNGFSIHRGIAIFWGDSPDVRVIGCLDLILSEFMADLRGLLAVQARKGQLSMLWAGDIPHDYAQEGWTVQSPDGDVWSVESMSFELGDHE